MSDEITNDQDNINSRDIIDRIEELAEILVEEPEGISEDEQEELYQLRIVAAQGEDSPDWEYGETLIRENEFESYARELAEDCGDLDANSGWPHTCIDWEQAVDELKQDYFEIDFDGITYYIRA